METKDTQKEVRPIIFEDQDYEKFEFDFRVLCALEGQTIGERFAALMNADLAKHPAVNADNWISQQQLIEELEALDKPITRQTLRNHRKNGTLPAEYFVESKIDEDQPNASKNQRTYYRKAECLAFYQNQKAESAAGE